MNRGSPFTMVSCTRTPHAWNALPWCHVMLYRYTCEDRIPQLFRFSRPLINIFAHKGSGGNKKLPSHGIPTVGIVRKVPSTPMQLSHKHHHHGGFGCPSHGVVSVGLPDPTTQLSWKCRRHVATCRHDMDMLLQFWPDGSMLPTRY